MRQTIAMFRISFLSLTCALGIGSGAALASSSAWHDAEGGRVRLVTTGQPDAEGKLRGALQIDLKPGWKTYWRDPGGSGVPPSIDVSASPTVVSAVLDFPPPKHQNDGYAIWAGYSHPVSLPVAFQLKPEAKAGQIDASVFLGICETICIPLQAKLPVDTGAAAEDAADKAVVDQAFASLPQPATETFGANVVEATDKTATIEVTHDGDAKDVELFLAGDSGYMFGGSERIEADGKARFVVKLAIRPKTKPSGPGLFYTLTSPTGSVSGLIPYF